MSEYIDREAAIEKLNELCGRVCQYSKAQSKCLENTGDGCDWHSIAHLRMCQTIIPAEEGET